MKPKHAPSAERVRELLDYDPTTGVIRWRIRPAYRMRVGDVAGTVHAITGYRLVRVDGIKVCAHRLAWTHFHGAPPSGYIDHINGDRGDNRVANLRDVSKSVNAQNRRAANSNNKSTGVLGVSSDGKVFRAHIVVDKKLRRLGVFETKEEAHAAYIAAKRQFHEGCML